MPSSPSSTTTVILPYFPSSTAAVVLPSSPSSTPTSTLNPTPLDVRTSLPWFFYWYTSMCLHLWYQCSCVGHHAFSWSSGKALFVMDASMQPSNLATQRPGPTHKGGNGATALGPPEAGAPAQVLVQQTCTHRSSPQEKNTHLHFSSELAPSTRLLPGYPISPIAVSPPFQFWGRHTPLVETNGAIYFPNYLSFHHQH
jgi:hypothetical protein